MEGELCAIATSRSQFARLVDVDREAARHLIAGDAEALDFGAAVGLALPGRGDTPMRLEAPPTSVEN